uniref:Uncharacterized protein n=1 Tax=Euplotes harpa TaxID=151035 RepID=A0A7S3N8Y1_9SPIT
MEFVSRHFPNKFKLSLHRIKADIGKSELDGVRQELKTVVAEQPDHVCVINASLVVLQAVSFAVHRALHSKKHASMKTDCLNKEILYCLYPSHGIAKSLEAIGVESIQSAFLLLAFEKDDKFYSLPENENVDCLKLQDIADHVDIAEMRKLYEITADEEATAHGFSAAVCNRLALMNH